MAIKVKHEGNVTSRVVAANMGGQAESSQKQALSMAQKSAGENAAANRQLQGAHASAPHAPTSSAQLTHASPGSIAAPSYTPLEERRLVTNEKVNDNQVYDEERKQWVGPLETGGLLDRKLGVEGTHKAALDRSIRANAVESDAQKKLNDLAMVPKTDGAEAAQPEQQVQYDYSGGQQFQDPYADLAKRFGISTEDMGRLKDSFQGRTTSAYQTISGMNVDQVRQRLQGLVEKALADKRRGLAATNAPGSGVLAAAMGTPQSLAPTPTPTPETDPLGAYDATLGGGFSVGSGASNAGIWGDRTGRIVTDGNFGL